MWHSKSLFQKCYMSIVALINPLNRFGSVPRFFIVPLPRCSPLSVDSSIPMVQKNSSPYYLLLRQQIRDLYQFSATFPTFAVPWTCTETPWPQKETRHSVWIYRLRGRRIDPTGGCCRQEARCRSPLQVETFTHWASVMGIAFYSIYRLTRMVGGRAWTSLSSYSSRGVSNSVGLSSRWHYCPRLGF